MIKFLNRLEKKKNDIKITLQTNVQSGRPIREMNDFGLCGRYI